VNWPQPEDIVMPEVEPELESVLDRLLVASAKLAQAQNRLAEAWAEGVMAKSNSSSIFDADVLEKNPYKTGLSRLKLCVDASCIAAGGPGHAHLPIPAPKDPSPG
jgi:hypothetical protein